jgi:hypothetical protein
MKAHLSSGFTRHSGKSGQSYSVMKELKSWITATAESFTISVGANFFVVLAAENLKENQTSSPSSPRSIDRFQTE